MIFTHRVLSAVLRRTNEYYARRQTTRGIRCISTFSFSFFFVTRQVFFSSPNLRFSNLMSKLKKNNIKLSLEPAAFSFYRTNKISLRLCSFVNRIENERIKYIIYLYKAQKKTYEW